MSKLTPHLSKLDQALKARGVTLKRAALAEVMASAFGFHNSHELSAAARRGALPNPPPAVATAPATVNVHCAITNENQTFEEAISPITVAHSTENPETRHVADLAEFVRRTANLPLHGEPEFDLDPPQACNFHVIAKDTLEAVIMDARKIINAIQGAESSRSTPPPINGRHPSVYADPATQRLFSERDAKTAAIAPDAEQANPEPAPSIRPFLEISTAHISQSTIDWLQEQGRIAARHIQTGDDEPVINIGSTMFGYWIWAGRDEAPSSAGENIPEDLLAVLAFARQCHADYVCLDCDADEYDHLPRYEH